MAENCQNASCEKNATKVAHCDTGQTKHYCDDHAGGRKAGIATVNEWEGI